MINLDEIKEDSKMKIMGDRDIFDSILKDSLLAALRTIIKINLENTEDGLQFKEKLNAEQTLAYLFKSRQKLVYSKDNMG